MLTSWMPHLLEIHCSDKGAVACYAGVPSRPSRVLHRTVASFPGLLVPVLTLWAAQGTRVLNDPVDAFRARDKLLTILALQQSGVPTVATLTSYEPSLAGLRMLGAGHMIIKPAHGVRGEGIVVHASPEAVAAGWAPVQWLPGSGPGGHYSVREHYLAQPLVREGGQDIRAFVVAGQCLGLMRRFARPGEVRANLALGGVAVALDLDHPGASTAVAAVKACGLDYAGVDIVEDEDGVLRVLEVDAWAGFAGMTEVTGADIAGAIVSSAISR